MAGEHQVEWEVRRGLAWTRHTKHKSRHRTGWKVIAPGHETSCRKRSSKDSLRAERKEQNAVRVTGAIDQHDKNQLADDEHRTGESRTGSSSTAQEDTKIVHDEVKPGTEAARRMKEYVFEFFEESRIKFHKEPLETKTPPKRKA